MGLAYEMSLYQEERVTGSRDSHSSIPIKNSFGRLSQNPLLLMGCQLRAMQQIKKELSPCVMSDIATDVASPHDSLRTVGVNRSAQMRQNAFIRVMELCEEPLRVTPLKVHIWVFSEL